MDLKSHKLADGRAVLFKLQIEDPESAPIDKAYGHDGAEGGRPVPMRYIPTRVSQRRYDKCDDAESGEKCCD